jgi:hypothetical protein
LFPSQQPSGVHSKEIRNRKIITRLRKDETFWASGNVEFLGFIRAIDSGTIALAYYAHFSDFLEVKFGNAFLKAAPRLKALIDRIKALPNRVHQFISCP